MTVAPPEPSWTTRISSPRPFLHELVALAWVVGCVVALENLPVTYTRQALAFAHGRFAVGVVLIFIIATAACWLPPIRRRLGSRLLSPGSSAILIVRVGAVWLFVMASHFVVKSFIYLINPRVWDQQLASLDRFVHLGLDPGSLLPALLDSPPLLHVLDVVYSGLYFPLLVVYTALLLALAGPRYKLTFAAAFTYVWVLGGVLYVLVPSWGPVFVSPSDYQQALLHMPLTVSVQVHLFEEISSLVNHPLAPRTVVFGCVAAFPSLHVAVISLFALASRTVSRRWFYWNLVLLGIMVVGSVVTGYHYLVDAWAGMILAAGAWWLANATLSVNRARGRADVDRNGTSR